MRSSIRRAFGPLLVLLVAAVPGASAQIRYPGYLPSFPTPAPASGVGKGGQPGNWLGGDASFMCPLDAERSYWSFADIAIAAPGVRERRLAANHVIGLSIGNSIAIATCRDGKFVAQHYYRGTPERPLPYFLDFNNLENHPKGTRLWLRKALMIDKHMYIFAMQTDDSGGIYNTLILRVANPLDPPPAWRYDYLSLGVFPAPKPGQGGKITPAPVNFGNEAFVDPEGKYLFVYGMHCDHRSAYDFFSKFRITALRIPLEAIKAAPAGADLAPVAQSMTRKFGVWKDGLHDPDDYHDVGIPAFNGFSARRNATLGAWQVVFSHDTAFAEYCSGSRKVDDPLVNSVFVMTGPSPWGPWSRPAAIAQYPELDPAREDLKDRPHGTECAPYFAAEQPAFEAWDGDIAFTYTVGSYSELRHHDGRPKLADLQLYNVYSWSAGHPGFAPLPATRPPGGK